MVVSGGVLSVTATAGSASTILIYPVFGYVNTSEYGFLEASIRSSVGGNGFTFNYLSGPGVFAGSGYVNAPYGNTGVFNSAFIDLSTPASFGNNWQSANATLNNGATFQPFFGVTAGDSVEVDYIRIRRGPVSGPSAPITATAGTSVYD
ncbi:MAG: hypothetical protein ACFCU1_02705 [Sumerlaeia bacterium]